MGVDFKYGAVATQYGTIDTEEPVFVFRAKDALLAEVLNFYATRCSQAGTPVGHINSIHAARERVEFWQALNGSKIPD